jgi:hypothetical protein
MRRLVLTLMAGLLFVGVGSPAWGQEAVQEDDQIVLTGRVVIAQEERVGDVVIFDGPASVAGQVNGDLLVFNGDLELSGQVTGDVMSFNGDVSLAGTARIGGDLVSRLAPNVEAGATIQGETRRFRPREWTEPFAFFAELAFWLAISVSTLILGLLLLLLAPRAADAVYESARTSIGPSIGWGFILFFGLPILAVLALLTLVGIPFGVVVLLALALIYSIGYVAAAWVVGRSISRTIGRVLAFLIGLGILRVLAIIPIVGGLTWFLGAVFGLGVLVVAAWRVRTRAVVVETVPV